MNWRILVLASAALLLAACTPKHDVKPEPVSVPAVRDEAVPDTLDYDFLGEEIPEVEPEPEHYQPEPDLPSFSEPEEAAPVSPSPPLPEKAGIAALEAGSGLLWVQIYATGSRDKAQEMARAAEKRLAYRVAVHYLDPYWKVLVGGFETREEAVTLRDLLVGMGYDDAWIFRP